MKDIKEVYNDDWGWWSDYTPMLESFEYEILLQIDDDDYQGDSRLLFKDNESYGYLIFGWGSCSGCDALQGCNTIEEVDELRTELFNEIKWFSSKEECLEYFQNKDWEVDFSWYYDGSKQFVKETIEILKYWR